MSGPNLDDYIPVNERISAFIAKYPEGSLRVPAPRGPRARRRHVLGTGARPNTVHPRVRACRGRDERLGKGAGGHRHRHEQVHRER